MNKGFTITFWIRVGKNPGWMQLDSDINFPPFVVNEGINVYFSKYQNLLKVYVLHPSVGYRKIVFDISDYIQKDMFVALTNSKNETKLYLNGSLKLTCDLKDLSSNLEVGDYVLANIQSEDLNNVKVGKNVEVVLPAKIKSIEKNKLTLFFFNVNEYSTLDISKLKI